MKKFITVLLTIALLVGAVVGTVYLCQKNNDKRLVKYDKDLGKEIVFVIDKGDTEKNETDITKLKFVNVGDEIKIADSFEGQIFIGKKADAEKDFVSLVISGVEKTSDGRYIVVDDVEVSVVNTIETIAPAQ